MYVLRKKVGIYAVIYFVRGEIILVCFSSRVGYTNCAPMLPIMVYRMYYNSSRKFKVPKAEKMFREIFKRKFERI